jgi:RNA polymerase sigma factor (sigma-70 family)
VALRFRTTPFRRLVPIARSACPSPSPAPQTPVDRDGTVVAYWYLCRRAARRFMRRGLDRADLEQVAAIGLIKAIDRYDRTQSAPFEAYAWLLVVGELMHYVRDSERFLRAPRGVRELERRWSAAARALGVARPRAQGERRRTSLGRDAGRGSRDTLVSSDESYDLLRSPGQLGTTDAAVRHRRRLGPLDRRAYPCGAFTVGATDRAIDSFRRRNVGRAGTTARLFAPARDALTSRGHRALEKLVLRLTAREVK